MENFDSKEAELVASIERHVQETQRVRDETTKLKKDVMKHRKRGKQLADELGRLKGETRCGAVRWSTYICTVRCSRQVSPHQHFLMRTQH